LRADVRKQIRLPGKRILNGSSSRLRGFWNRGECLLSLRADVRKQIRLPGKRILNGSSSRLCSFGDLIKRGLEIGDVPAYRDYEIIEISH
jgi:hypothetical protein